MMERNHKKEERENILLFIPNLITFSRVLLMLMMGGISEDYYLLVPVLFMINIILDYADGIAARYFNQCTKFGQVLDCICDDLNMGLLYALSYMACTNQAYKFYLWVEIIVRLGGGWLLMMSSSMMNKTTHKVQGDDVNWVLRIYYTPWILDAICIPTGIFDCAQYLIWFTDGPTVFSFGLVHLVFWILMPFHVFFTAVYCGKALQGLKWLIEVSLREREKLKE